MKIQRIFSLMLIVALLLSPLAGTARADNEISGSAVFAESEAINLAQKWAMLVSEANVSELQTLLNDKYMHIHATALVESKSQFLEAFKNGTRKYDPIKIEDLNVRVFGNSAVVTGKFNLKALVRGKTIEGVNRFGLFLNKGEAGQQVISFQATAIPQQK